MLDNNITRCPDGSSQLETRYRSESQRQREGFGPSVTHGWATPAKMRKKYCYGREKNLGQYSSLSSTPTHLSHKRNITLSRIKCEIERFCKEACAFVIAGWWWFRSLLIQLSGRTSTGRAGCGPDLAGYVSVAGFFLRPQGAFPHAITPFGRLGWSPDAWSAPYKGNADGAVGIFGKYRARVGYGLAPGPTKKRSCATISRSMGRGTNTACRCMFVMYTCSCIIGVSIQQ